jgi:hypothetical protein
LRGGFEGGGFFGRQRLQRREARIEPERGAYVGAVGFGECRWRV